MKEAKTSKITLPDEPVTRRPKQFAFKYARQGLPVLRLHGCQGGACTCKKGTGCERAGKHPTTAHGVKDATTDCDVVTRWFDEQPNANVGIATGAVSNLLVVDVDGAEGRKSLRELQDKYGRLPKTVTVKTGNGKHYYFRLGKEAIGNTVGRLGKGIDIRGDGGYVVAPGSTHASGAQYKFMPGRGLNDIKIAKAPRWLRRRIVSVPQRDPQTIPAVRASQIDRVKAYCSSALEQELSRLRKAPDHQRNETLNRCAFKLGQLLPYGQIDREAVTRDLAEAAKAIGLESEEIPATIKSGFDAGVTQPRSLPFLRAATERGTDVVAPVAGTKRELIEKLSKLGETDTDNAQRLADRFADKIIYTKAQGWLVYKRGRWFPGADTQCVELAKKVARSIAKESKYLTTAEAKAARDRFAKQSLSKGALDRMLDLAKGLVEVDACKLDADPWLFNTANGTIDLRTGDIEPYDPRDLITVISPVLADRRAKCPTFKKFLKRITGNDKGLCRYIQKCVGYSMTGRTTEQVFFFCHGQSGNNGKSTLINLIRDMLGDYGLHTPSETLMTKQYDNAIPNDLARLSGVRMVTAIETNPGRHLDEAKLKAMTGGEKITARFMRQDYFEFTPAFKLWFVANDRPRVRGTDTAMWRRIRVIPFNVQVPEAEVDKNLTDKLKAEWSGILAWAVRGCLAWQKHGLKPPAAVELASKEWADAADHVKRFVLEALTSDAGNRIQASSMHDHYSRWCNDNGEQPLNTTQFKNHLTSAHNIQHKRTKRGSEWLGVKYRL